MTTEAERKAIKKYNTEKVERVVIRVPKGQKEKIKKFAANHGESLNEMINRLINEELSSDKQ